MKQINRQILKVHRVSSRQKAFQNRFTPRKLFCLNFIAFLCMMTYSNLMFGANPEEKSLPVLNDPLSGIISPEKEQEIGRLLIRQIRSQLPVLSDPLSSEYLRSLSYRLAENSELKNKKLSTLIIKDSSINAFAVPGGVIAVHSGLFEAAENEDEFSAVLAHEIAHLSQRHFARMLDEQRNSQAATLGAYLASILVLMTAGAEPGIGAIAATQAASQQNALRFSRKNEQEADRIGMQTLIKADMNPDAMTNFFMKLQRASQYAGDKPPEYLLTHPVTESRIADSKSRSSQYEKKQYDDKLSYQLIRNRLAVISSNNTKTYQKDLEDRIEKSTGVKLTGERYGLALCYMENKDYKAAAHLLKQLQKDDPTRIAYAVTEAEIQFASANYEQAKKILEAALDIHPNNYPLSMIYAETLIRNKQIGEAIYLLQTLSLSEQDDPYVWRRLAEAHGLKGQRLGVYRAKAEYFFLYGLNEQALIQLKYALPLAEDNFQLKSKIQGRIEAIEKEETELKL